MNEHSAEKEQSLYRLQRSYRDLCNFWEWAQVLETVTDEQEVVRRAAQLVQRIVCYQACALIERVNGRGRLGDCFLPSGQSTSAGWAEAHLTSGAIAWSVGLRQPLVLADATSGSFIIIPFPTVNNTYIAMDLRTSLTPESITQHRLELLTLLARRTAVALENARLFAESHRAHYLSTTAALVRAVDAKDPNTQGHSERVMQYALLLRDHLSDDGVNCESIRLAGLLHDIGKIGMRDHILFKEKHLTDAEMEDVKQHPVLSARILEPTTLPREVVAAVRHHHERWDGRGYPDGLHGEAIPLIARVVAIADAFDAMTSGRSYRRAMTCAEALQEITARAGVYYDPELTRAFVEVIRQLNPDETLSGIPLAASLLGSRDGLGTTLMSTSPLSETL